MCRAPEPAGEPKGPALRTMFLTGVLLILVVETNTQELPETMAAANKIIMMLKDNMEEMKNQIATMQTSFMGIKEEFQIIKKFNNMPAPRKENYENIVCPELFIPINITGECFLVGTERVTYKEASDRCKSIGAYLAVPNDYNSLGPFLDSDGSGPRQPAPQYLWIGINDQLTPNIWRWTDDTAVDALTLLYNWDDLNRINHTYYNPDTRSHHTQDNPTKPGYNCGVLVTSRSPTTPMELNLESRRCDLVRNSYLCEIEPGKISMDIDASPALCPKGFSALQTGECMYVSTAEESTSYLEAENMCSSRGGKLALPMDAPSFSTHLHKQNLVDDPDFWLYIEYINRFPYISKSWNDTAPDILLVDEDSEANPRYWQPPGREEWLSKGYCPLVRAGAIPYNWDNWGVDDCSATHRFICSIWPGHPGP